MKSNFEVLLLMAMLTQPAIAENCPDLLQVSMEKLREAESVDFCHAYRGKVILAVNTASECGFTPQFKGLEALYRKYQAQGFVILGFPSGDFFQEFSDAEKTARVCYVNYGVTFPMFTKSVVRGDDANPFFRKLIGQSATSPKWNFYKYLIDRKGMVRAVFGSPTTPEDVELNRQIETLLSEDS